MQEEFDKIIADLNRYSTVQREVAMLGMFADFVRFGGQKAAELEEAGYHEQAVELRRRLAEMMPDAASLPPLALPQSRPAAAGTVPTGAGLPLSRRRGRPPKNQTQEGGPTS
jgi:hypothetical protein